MHRKKTFLVLMTIGLMATWLAAPNSGFADQGIFFSINDEGEVLNSPERPSDLCVGDTGVDETIATPCCADIVTDSFFQNLIDLLNAENAEAFRPLFSQNIVSRFSGDFPFEIHVGIEDTLANFAAFFNFVDELNYELTSIDQRQGCRLAATLETNLTFVPAGAPFRFVGTQTIFVNFHRGCLIKLWAAETFGEFVPIDETGLLETSAR